MRKGAAADGGKQGGGSGFGMGWRRILAGVSSGVRDGEISCKVGGSSGVG